MFSLLKLLFLLVMIIPFMLIFDGPLSLMTIKNLQDSRISFYSFTSFIFLLPILLTPIVIILVVILLIIFLFPYFFFIFPSLVTQVLIFTFPVLFPISLNSYLPLPPPIQICFFLIYFS